MTFNTPSLITELLSFEAELIIFDKDGTLIDFHRMWGDWIVELARRLEASLKQPIAEQLFKALDFDASTGEIIPHGALSICPIAELRALTIKTLQAADLAPQVVETAITTAWHTPDPITMAHPLTDLEVLFKAIKAHQAKVAIATSDNQDSAKATMTNLGVVPLLDYILGADEGIPIKPAPDMILTICNALNISPLKTVMVGDNADDLKMGRAAGVGLNIGVLSGVSTKADLAPHADMILPSIADLLTSD